MLSRAPLAQVRLEGCTFENNTLNTLPTLLAENRGAPANATAAFFGDAATPAVCAFEGPDLSTGVPACVDSPAQPLADAGDGFLSREDEWLGDVQGVSSNRKTFACMHAAAMLIGTACMTARGGVGARRFIKPAISSG